MTDQRPISMPFDDETLLAYVEGDLSPEAARKVEAALARDPAALATLRAMQTDTLGLRSMGDVAAPPGLLTGLADAIERQMLLGVREEGESVSATPPPSMVVPGMKFSTRAASMRRMAMAAGLVLCVGAAAWMAGSITAKRNPPPAQSPDVAMSDGVGGGRMGLEAMDAGRTEMAKADRSTPSAEAPAPPPETAEGDAAALAQATEPLPEPMKAERAATLLAEGRLVMRVRTGRPEALREWLERVDRRSNALRLAQAEDLAPTGELLAMLQPPKNAPGRARSRAPMPVADDGRGRAVPPVSLDRALEEPGLPRIEFAPHVLYVELAAEMQTLESASRAVEAQAGWEIEFVELAEPMLLSVMPPDATELLWWLRPASEWKPRSVLPLVVEPAW